MLLVTTESGTYYTIDEENHWVKRSSERPLKWISDGVRPEDIDVDGRRPYDALYPLDIGGSVYALYRDGTFSMSTAIVSIETIGE
jgi:hypothetical protein